jgi:hypothetical protein
MKKRGLCFIYSIFVVEAEIKVTLLMSSFSSILFKLFVFNIKDFSILMMIFFVKFDGNVSNFFSYIVDPLPQLEAKHGWKTLN